MGTGGTLRARTNRARRVLVTLLMSVVVLTLIVGCGASSQETTAASSGQASIPQQITILAPPFIGFDPVWMAQAQGYFKAQGLNVQIVPFSSGTTASATFKTGRGDFLATGDLPAITNWFSFGQGIRVVAALERDYGSYWAIARNDIRSPQDLAGKQVGTRVGSTGSYFLSEYLSKNNVSSSQVHVVNLETQDLTPAICKGEISAYFLWEPYITQTELACGSQVHRLTSAQGYVEGYSVLSARLSFLQKYPVAAERVLRAIQQGAQYADTHEQQDVQFYHNQFHGDIASFQLQWKVAERPVALDTQFYHDFCQESAWARSAGILKSDQQLVLNDWAWRQGWLAIDPKVTPTPPASTC